MVVHRGALCFEILSMVLLVAIVGVVVMGKRELP